MAESGSNNETAFLANQGREVLRTDPLLIAVYNQKGGCGKTTSSYNFGIKMTQTLELRVLLVDGDPQCNLTGRVFAGRICLEEVQGVTNDSRKKTIDEMYEEWNDQYNYKEDNGSITTIEHLFYPINSQNSDQVGLSSRKSEHLGRAKMFKETEVPNYGPRLCICPGDPNIDDIEHSLSLAVTGVAYKTNPKYITEIFREIGRVKGFHVVIFDLNPGSSYFNKSVVAGVDYVVTPFFPTFFSYQAILRLKRLLPSWIEDVSKNCSGFENQKPLFLGGFPGKIRQNKKDVIASMLRWMRKIYEEIDNSKTSLKANKLISDHYRQPWLVGVKDFQSTGYDIQACERGMADTSFRTRLKFHRRKNNSTRPMNETDRSRMDEASNSYDKVIGMMFVNMKNEDVRKLPKNVFPHTLNSFVLDEEDLVLGSGFDNFSEYMQRGPGRNVNMERPKKKKKKKKKKRRRRRRRRRVSLIVDDEDEDEDDDEEMEEEENNEDREYMKILLSNYFDNYHNVKVLSPMRGKRVNTEGFKKQAVNVMNELKKGTASEYLVVIPVNHGTAKHDSGPSKSGNFWSVVVIQQHKKEEEKDSTLRMWYADPRGVGIPDQVWNKFEEARKDVFPDREQMGYRYIYNYTEEEVKKDYRHIRCHAVEYARLIVERLMKNYYIHRSDTQTIKDEQEKYLKLVSSGTSRGGVQQSPSQMRDGRMTGRKRKRSDSPVIISTQPRDEAVRRNVVIIIDDDDEGGDFRDDEESRIKKKRKLDDDL